MTIARRRPAAIAAIAPRSPDPVPVPSRPASMPLPIRDAPAPEAVTPMGRLRRCVFRRIDRAVPLPQRSAATYEVMCLYGDGDSAIPLGDIESARPICQACTAPGIFRPDEA